MPDRPEIPQDMARDAVDLVREWRSYLSEKRLRGDTPTPEDADARSTLLLQRLDALEQPPDPAEVAGRDYEECNRSAKACGGWAIGDGIAAHVAYHNRQAYAEREKVVKELSDYIEDHKAGDHLGPVSVGAHELNARVHRLFRFDKEKP